MTRTEIILILGAVALALAGLAADRYLWPDAFARAGALMVIYGVTLAGRALYVSERAHARHEARFEKLEAAYLDASASENGTVTPEAFSRLAKSYAELRENRIERTGRLMLAEVGIVCAGTLIWGFGDLAF